MRHLPLHALLISLAVALILAACGGSSTSPEATTPKPDAPLQIIVPGTDTAVGPNRLVVALLDAQGSPFGSASVRLRFYHADGPTPNAVKSELPAMWLGDTLNIAQPVYSGRPSFDAPGKWDVEAIATRDGVERTSGKGRFIVKSRTDVPNLGDAAPLSRQATLADAPIEQLTSERPPGDPDFYRLTIADAIAQKKPLLVLFSTPAFCQTRTCGPQLDVAQELKQRYGAQMNFIHVEIFERPDLLLAGQGKAKGRAAVLQWRLPSEPWLFLIDADGKIFDRFEGYAPGAEVEPRMKALLKI
jgi:hypothetical protein